MLRREPVSRAGWKHLDVQVDDVLLVEVVQALQQLSHTGAHLQGKTRYGGTSAGLHMLLYVGF